MPTFAIFCDLAYINFSSSKQHHMQPSMRLWISHREDHHPDITVGFNTCRVAYKTHAIGGLSENDFICAAKLDALFDL